MDATLRALNRFGLGARPGERTGVKDPRGWLLAQLSTPAPLFGTGDLPSPEGIGSAVRTLRAVGQGNPQQRQEARRRVVQLGSTELRAALAQRVSTERPFVERLVAFWSNHLCVSTAAKVLVTPFAGSYERDAIRPHVLGRFEDMVLASAKHPAMLVYLDNFQSVGPESQGAQVVGRRNVGGRRGLNENYARELMELHTLGVNGGYTQADVQELARLLTGWTLDGLAPPNLVNTAGRGRRAAAAGAARQVPDGPIRFAFVAAFHDPGDKQVMARRYSRGVGEGERAIRDLCRHPSTARFVASKLVRHFVADEPSTAAIDRVATVFEHTDGDLGAVARALVEEPDAWRDDGGKFRTPQDWLVAVCRACGIREIGPNVPNVLRQLRHPLWSPPSPKGFGDTLREWGDPDSLLNRAELARTLSRMPAVAATVDPRSLLDIIDIPAGTALHSMLSDSSIAAQERLALAFAGPAFQWR